MPTIRRGLCSILLVIFFIFAARVMAQQPESVPQAPVPSQIAAAKKIFISNGGGEDTPYAHGQQLVLQDAILYGGGPDRAYNQFYLAMKNWGRYDLVSAPADADLVFEIAFLPPSFWKKDLTNAGRFRLVILDPKAQIVLWTFNENVERFNRKKTGEKNFNTAFTNLVERVKSVVAQTR